MIKEAWAAFTKDSVEKRNDAHSSSATNMLSMSNQKEGQEKPVIPGFSNSAEWDDESVSQD